MDLFVYIFIIIISSYRLTKESHCQSQMEIPQVDSRTDTEIDNVKTTIFWSFRKYQRKKNWRKRR